MIRIEKYVRERQYAVYEHGELVVVAVYKKGALAVQARLITLLEEIANLKRRLREATASRTAQPTQEPPP